MRNSGKLAGRIASGLIALSAVILSAGVHVYAQTSGGTVISNQASITYSDGTNSYSASSNTVTVTVAYVAALEVTPDAGSTASIVAGETKLLTFTVRNSGNFAQGVIFPSGGGIVVSGTGSVTVKRAVIDSGTTAGAIDAGDTNILAGVTSSSLAANGGTLTVLVEVEGTTTTGSVSVSLGDASTGGPAYDNQAADSTANTVKTALTTVSGTPVANGQREAKGSYDFQVVGDAMLRVDLTVPAGPVALGGTITYSTQVCNTATAPTATAQAMNLGAYSGVFIVFPIPVGTSLTSGQSFTGSLQTLYSTDPLTTTPVSATWSNTAPADLSTVRRIAFKVGDTLAAGACGPASAISFTVTVASSGVNTSTPIYAIADAFAKNNATTPVVITDQSGDSTPGNGDGNADFDEPASGSPAVTGKGFRQPTTLTTSGNVLNGVAGNAGATGPDGTTSSDFTAKGANVGINVAPGSVSTAVNTVAFTNTLQNTGTGNDTYTIKIQNAASLFSSLPAGASVTLATAAGGGSSVTITSSNPNDTLSVPVSYGGTADYTVTVTVPAGTTVLPTASAGTATEDGGYSVKLLATSGATPAATNLTTDIVYVGFVRLAKTATISNTDTTKGSATDPVPGAEITYTITYTNIAKATTGGVGSVSLSASSLVITEDGNAAPNNWGATTDRVASSETDSRSGVIVYSNSDTRLVDTVPGSLAPGQSGTLTFKRRIK
ncbi:MAG TPA: hypothetical protein VNQ79_13385 [Blastocatellia bacterium]|nr:hypothetical protein [Blastocatellia bacterium]